MMDKTLQESKSNVKDMLIKRENERKTKIEKMKEEKGTTMQDQVHLFNESFAQHRQEIENILTIIESGQIEQKDLPEQFNKISKDLQILNRYLSVSTIFLNNYVVRVCLQTIEELQNKYKELETQLLPKKKFGFKSKRTRNLSQSERQVDEVDADINKIIALAAIISCGFTDKKNENLKMAPEEIFKKDVELRNLEECIVLMQGNPSTVHISNVNQCKILCGPVSTSVFVENCRDCTFVLACQQLRIHSTHGSSFYIHVTSRAIIEDTDTIEFAPYNLSYDDIDKHFELSGIDVNQNNWNSIDDFNWLASDMVSPNWKVVKESDRVTDWLTYT